MNILLLTLLFLLSTFFLKDNRSQAAEVVNVIKSANYRTLRAEIYYQESKASIVAPRLKITHTGQILFNEPIVVEGQETFAKIVTPLAVDLDGDWEAEVVIDVATKDIKGLNYSVIYKYDPETKKYRQIVHGWDNFAYGRTVKDIDKDGSLEFLTYDNRFSSKFVAGDGTLGPIKIWKFKDGQIVDVTTQFKDIVYSNATKLWQQYDELRHSRKKDPSLQRVLLAAYLGDKYTLGQAEEAWKLIKESYRYRDHKKYFELLKTFLDESGYTKVVVAPETEKPTADVKDRVKENKGVKSINKK